MNFCLVHLRQFSVERIDCLTTPLFSQDLRCSTTTCKRCPSAFWRWCTLQEDPSCLEYTGTHNCAIVPKPSDHPERNLISILLMRFHSISGQRSRGLCHNLRHRLGLSRSSTRERYARKSCGHHLIHTVVWVATKSTMNATAVWWRFPSSKDQPIDLLLARVFIKHRMIQVHSLKQTNPDRLCAFSWRASGLGFVLFWSFESLPQCLRIRRVGLSLNCWECWVVRG